MKRKYLPAGKAGKKEKMINVDLIKKLRTQTSAGIAEIREALEEAKGNEKKTKELLRQRGLTKAGKRNGRKTSAGLVESYLHASGTSGAVVVLACETDFVARNGSFKTLAHELAMQVCAMAPKNEKEFLVQPWIRDESITIDNLIKQHIAKFGENIKIAEFKRFKI